MRLCLITSPNALEKFCIAISLSLHRRFYRLIYRFDLELSNSWEVEGGAKWAYAQERAKRLRTTLWVKAEKFLGMLLARFKVTLPHSQAYRMATLGEAHEKAYETYHPQLYQAPSPFSEPLSSR